jgi:phosphoribosyl-ATP pyrophosphohydrolase
MSAALDRLYAAIVSRQGGDPATSYTAKLFARGGPKIAQKLGEEAVEVAIAAVQRDSDAVIKESGDLLYHLLVVWAELGIRPEQVWHELAAREGVSGIAEKASRKKKD